MWSDFHDTNGRRKYQWSEAHTNAMLLFSGWCPLTLQRRVSEDNARKKFLVFGKNFQKKMIIGVTGWKKKRKRIQNKLEKQDFKFFTE
jgi:hypothetical protein